MPLTKRKKAIFTSIIIVLILATSFFLIFNGEQEEGEVNVGNIIEGEIISLDESEETVEIQINYPPHTLYVSNIKVRSDSYWAPFRASETEEELEYIEVDFDYLTKDYPVFLYYTSSVDGLSVSELSTPERFVIDKETGIVNVGNIIEGEIISLDESEETVEIQINYPPHTLYVSNIKVRSDSYWAPFRASETEEELEYIEVDFDYLTKDYPVFLYYTSSVDGLSVSELSTPERFVIDREVVTRN